MELFSREFIMTEEPPPQRKRAIITCRVCKRILGIAHGNLESCPTHGGASISIFFDKSLLKTRLKDLKKTWHKLSRYEQYALRLTMLLGAYHATRRDTLPNFENTLLPIGITNIFAVINQTEAR